MSAKSLTPRSRDHFPARCGGGATGRAPLRWLTALWQRAVAAPSALPLDRAADRRNLLLWPLSGRRDQAHCFDQLPFRASRRRPLPAGIQAAAIFGRSGRADAEEIGRADRLVSAGDGLAFIVQIRERQVVALGETPHVRERIFRV